MHLQGEIKGFNFEFSSSKQIRHYFSLSDAFIFIYRVLGADRPPVTLGFGKSGTPAPTSSKSTWVSLIVWDNFCVLN